MRSGPALSLRAKERFRSRHYTYLQAILFFFPVDDDDDEIYGEQHFQIAHEERNDVVKTFLTRLFRREAFVLLFYQSFEHVWKCKVSALYFLSTKFKLVNWNFHKLRNIKIAPESARSSTQHVRAMELKIETFTKVHYLQFYCDSEMQSRLRLPCHKSGKFSPPWQRE